MKTEEKMKRKSKSNYEIPPISLPKEIIVDIKEYERLLGYKEAWEKMRRLLNSDDPRLCFHSCGVTYFDKAKLLNRMTEIRKQCTKKEKDGKNRSKVP